MKPLVAIVGRPNVGKSTLFNRLVGRRQALVTDFPGVTRDRLYGTYSWAGAEWLLVDTGGLVSGGDALEAKVSAQSLVAVAEADLVLCVVDGRSGPALADETVIQGLRRSGRPVLYVVNKCEQDTDLSEFQAKGWEHLIAISAEHGIGIGALLDQIQALTPGQPTAPDLDEMKPTVGLSPRSARGVGPSEQRRAQSARAADGAPLEIAISIIGRPNVGKSTLLNALVGAPRVVAHDLPGTTRDVIDVALEREGRKYLLLDTAGIRRKARTTEALEKYAILKSLRSIDRADVVLLILDATEGITHQDRALASAAWGQGRPVLLIYNKWDLVQGAEHEYVAAARDILGELGRLPILCLSAQHGTGLAALWDQINRYAAAVRHRLTTSDLNRFIQDIQRHHHIPVHQGHQVKLYYATQVGVAPPRVVCFTNFPQAIATSYRRYVVKQLEALFGLPGLPIQLLFRKK